MSHFWGSVHRGRPGLPARKQQFESTQNSDAVIENVLSDLRAARPRIDKCASQIQKFAAVAPGLATTFRQCQRAFRAAYEDPLPENFHEWRKRAKDHWYHIRLLENLWTAAMEAYESSLKTLDQCLGADHNLPPCAAARCVGARAEA